MTHATPDTMPVEWVDIDTLTPDPDNARKHARKSIDAIKRSLKQFGQVDPLIVDAEGIVRAGNGRLVALLELKEPRARVLRIPLSGAKAKAFAIAHNQTATLSTWDDAKLAEALAEVQNLDGLDETITGFTAAEIDKLLEPPEDPADAEDVEVPEVWQIVVTCRDEAEQERVYTQLKQEGVACRLSSF